MRFNSANINVMVKASSQASKIIIRDFGELEKLQVSLKGPGDFVTASDKKVEKILIDELQKARPDYSILSEEIGEIKNKNKDFRWIIDPIDGTNNFMHAIPHFAISIALEHKSEIICGVIFDPIKNELFFAEKGNGSFLNNQRIRVSSRKEIENSILFSSGHNEEYKKISNKIISPVRNFGSAALDLAYVAAGRCDACWEKNINYWDIAAGLILIKEAGGFISDLQGNNNYLENRTILATNSGINKDMINLFNS